MTSFQRVGLVFLSILAVMICFPDYPVAAAWRFVGIIFILWLGVIMVLSVFLGLFGLDKFEFVNRLVAFALLCGIFYSLLWYFPQENKIAPITQLTQGSYPSMAQIKKGIKKITFNFDVVHRNVKSQQNFLNQDFVQPAKEPAKTQPVKKAVEETEVDIFVEE